MAFKSPAAIHMAPSLLSSINISPNRRSIPLSQIPPRDATLSSPTRAISYKTLLIQYFCSLQTNLGYFLPKNFTFAFFSLLLTLDKQALNSTIILEMEQDIPQKQEIEPNKSKFRNIVKIQPETLESRINLILAQVYPQLAQADETRQNCIKNLHQFRCQDGDTKCKLNSPEIDNRGGSPLISLAHPLLKKIDDFTWPTYSKKKIRKKVKFRKERNAGSMDEIKSFLKQERLSNNFQNFQAMSQTQLRNQFKSDGTRFVGSQYRGVSRTGNQFQMAIMVDGKNKQYTGRFQTAKEAGLAYDKASIQLRGLKAKTNLSYTKGEVLDILLRDDHVFDISRLFESTL